MTKKSKFSQENPSTTIKKATQLYVVGGVAHDPEIDAHAFWYAVRKFPTMPKALKERTKTDNTREYVEQERPEFGEGSWPTNEYVDFYKQMPEEFGEGDADSLKKIKKFPTAAQSIIEWTIISDYPTKATGDSAVDNEVVIEIVKKVRKAIWSFPVSDSFVGVQGLQAEEMQSHIDQHLIANSNKKLTKTASFKVLPNTIRYIAVDTGEIFTSEPAVQQHIQEQQLDLAAAASNRGGIMKKAIKELLKIADDLDQAGAHAEADEVVEIMKELAEQPEESKEEAQEEAQVEASRIARTISTLVKVADALDAKGAFKEAQMVDTLMQEMPQAFGPSSVQMPEQQMPVQMEQSETPFSQLPEANVTPEMDIAPEMEAPVETGPVAPEISELTEPTPDFDTLDLGQFQDMIDGMKHRFSQGKQREQYEQIMERANRAQEYKRAYEEWLASAHEMFGDTPIRLDV